LLNGIVVSFNNKKLYKNNERLNLRYHRVFLVRGIKEFTKEWVSFQEVPIKVWMPFTPFNQFNKGRIKLFY